MSRYTTLIKSTEHLYAEGSPIFIAASALLKDNETENILLQLKFKNISDNIISAVKVYVKTFDISSKELECVEEYQYLDLYAEKGAEFGQNKAITLPNPNTRQFTVACTEIVFNDGSSIKIDKNVMWEKLPPRTVLEEYLEKNLCEQYRRDTFQEAKYVVEDYEDLWFCSCGHINKNVKNVCEVCNKDKLQLLSALDKNILNEHLELYKKEEAEREEQLKLLKVKKVKEDKIKAQKLAKIGIVVAIIVIICVIVGILITQVFIPMSTYNKAKDLMHDGEFEEAIIIFESLENYKDSQKLMTYCENGIKEGLYQDALALFKNNQFDEAISIFESLELYKDSSEQINAIKEAKQEYLYQEALNLLNNKNYLASLKILRDIDYNDSKDLIKSIVSQCPDLYFYVAPVGSSIYFGKYEQDGNLSNGKEAIEWRILEKEDNKILVISKYLLEVKPYHDNKNDSTISWEDCSLRKWLNKDFYSCFNSEEQNLICDTEIYNGNNHDTIDKVFILSKEEAIEYKVLALCAPTQHVVNRLRIIDSVYHDECDYEIWWLRTQVDYDSVYYVNDYYFSFEKLEERLGYAKFFLKKCTVRPAMWIDISGE